MAEPEDDTPESVRLRIRREAGGLLGKMRGWGSAGLVWWQQTKLRDWYAEHWASSRKGSETHQQPG